MRTRSEYLLNDLEATPLQIPPGLELVRPSEVLRELLAGLLLDAYRGTVDDEGEDEADARAAVDFYLERLEVPHSVVLVRGDEAVCMAFVVIVDGIHYIDPVATAPQWKRQGLGRAAVSCCLASLASESVEVVGAVITDGNHASERLFAALGFKRVGPWPREPLPASVD